MFQSIKFKSGGEIFSLINKERGEIMKGKKIVEVGLAAIIALSGVASAAAPAFAAPDVIYPNVQSYTKDSDTFTLPKKSRLLVVSNEKTLNNEVLLRDLKRASSQLADRGVLSEAPQIVFGTLENAADNDIIVKMGTNPDLTGKNDAYAVDIKNNITISAEDETGIYYGLTSVIQMLIDSDRVLTKGNIVDYSDVEDRSFHLDCARKFFTKDWIISLIKDLSWQKYNSIQIHFSENEGFRLQSDTLEAIDGFQYVNNQYLTKQDMLEIIQVANEYHIEVIPSLDSPGHLGAVLRYLPSDYSCASLFPSDGRRAQCFNIFTNDEARGFLIDLMTEFIDFFSEAGCKRFNIGGDEFLEKFSNFSNEQYVQIMEYFNEVSAIVKSKGMTPRTWNDGVMYGNYTGYKLDPDIEICYWAAPQNCASIEKFVQNGNKVINFSDIYMYYVLSSWWLQNACPEGDRIYREWNPGKFSTLQGGIPQTYKKPYANFIKGGSYAVWCDVPGYMTQDSVANNIFYRTRATAYKMWNTSDSMPEYADVKKAFDKIGRVPGYKSILPEPGQVLYEGQSVALTIEYKNEFGQTIEPTETLYGLKDNEYTIEPKELYGYKFEKASESLTGTYKENKTITLTYKTFTDKEALAKEVNNALVIKDYIPETVKEYKEALDASKDVKEDPTAGQKKVDETLAALRTAKEKAVKAKFYKLYVEAYYPVSDAAYASGYQAYMNAVNNGKNTLKDENLDVETAEAAYNNIMNAKKALIKKAADKPTISATKGYYSWYSYNNMIDGNRNSKCWFGANQTAGDEVLFTFPSKVKLSGVNVVQADQGDILRDAEVQISADKINWTTVGTLKDTDPLEKRFDFDAQEIKYVRIYINSGYGAWYQISEVEFVLESIGEDTTLKDLIEKAKEEDLEGKTVASRDEFLEALIEAQKALVAEDIKNEEVINRLNEAIEGLVDAPVVNTDALDEAIAKANALTEEEVNKAIKKNVEVFNKALADAKAVLAKDEPTQEEIDAAVKTLNEALDGLKVLRGNPEALNSALEAASKKDESKYTAESWAALMAVVEEVKAIDLENATQKEIDKAVVKLNKAVDALEEKVVIEPEKPTVPEKPTEKPEIKPEDKKHDTVKTGDSTMILGMVALMAVSAIVYISLKRKKFN
ncbi:family 20 glycosylhydrolase [Catenibacterium mitsuokai]|uniref:Family 20 glycosylhydrolase n=2 Tax=Catenibacterium mitsuokai TaxID=100886 RepID=A0AAW4MRR4_9FIRM|nr:family 20 glycosylhydrolase [Catenibacterium mitsuokai]MBV3369842.1 family 20 glycosylhydrolase [Catenibacterium mitsuokai]MBV3375085.1 family 20 glycosylhydrolase [Catenibacterium mitsuokai]MBV3377274.1 family 20 glycosylhydrolase [Catenibacterium mitsuokai]MBV3379681.1 family 20 glycosylhydrolase [Catenibacterium mitsuokai]